MAVYCPPSFNEYLTVFNSANWICGENNDGTFSSGGISLAYADSHYLKFPSAQGNETLVGINVLGTSQFNGALNEFTNTADFNGTTNFNNNIKLNVGHLRFPDATQQITAYTGAPSVASSVVINTGGSGTLYMTMVAGNVSAGVYPILVDIPTYTTATSTLNSPSFSGNLSTNTITNPSAVALDLLSVNSTPIPPLTGNSGMMIGWNESSGDGESNLRNYSQGGGAGGFLFSTISLTLPNLNLLRLTRTATTFYQAVSAPSVSATTFTGALSGNATTATTATTATQIAITPNGNNATHYLTFSDSNTAGNINLHTNSGITCNPSTDTITSSNFIATNNISTVASQIDSIAPYTQPFTTFTVLPQCSITATTSNQLTNLSTVQSLISGIPGGQAFLSAGTALSNQIFTGWNTFTNLLTASGGISSSGITSTTARNYGFTAGSNWMYIQATCNALLNGGINYFRPNALYILEGDLSMFITTNYAAGGFFQVVNTGVYEIAVSFSINNAVSVNIAQIALYSGAIPTTYLNRSCDFNTTPLNMSGSGTWTIQLIAGTDYGFMNSINSTPYNSTGSYNMSVVRIM